ncbi:hypothetical protein NDU88_003940 [Pleurodeles waltl]|uniref:Uncharacterized protein n=1 Tax=Pleurodeles waltl TaxID=8319 RepID=A0AAV7PB06_PLEWA|nr:hypothetical protein NDU88_003940 [Pleurodeles waltl]
MVEEPSRDNNNGRAGRYRTREEERWARRRTLQNAVALRSRPDRAHNTPDRWAWRSTAETALGPAGPESADCIHLGGAWTDTKTTGGRKQSGRGGHTLPCRSCTGEAHAVGSHKPVDTVANKHQLERAHTSARIPREAVGRCRHHRGADQAHGASPSAQPRRERSHIRLASQRLGGQKASFSASASTVSALSAARQLVSPQHLYVSRKSRLPEKDSCVSAIPANAPTTLCSAGRTGHLRGAFATAYAVCLVLRRHQTGYMYVPKAEPEFKRPPWPPS